MAKTNTKFSILMFPWLAYSHVHPFFQLSKALSRRNFHIHFCSSAINLDSIRKNSETYSSSIHLVELELPSSPQLPPHLHTTKNLPPNLLPILLQTFQESDSSFREILNTLKPDLLIYDFFQPWAAKLALSRGIPSVYFAASGAAPFSYFYHLFAYGSTGSPFPYDELYLLDCEKVDLEAPVELNVKDADQDFAFGNFNLSCGIVLIRGMRGVDGKYIDYLSELCKKRVVPTGPLVLESSDYEGNSEILQWLSEKERFSTVYVCFGSEHFLSKEQLLELARGLEVSGVNFVWVVRFPESELPEGFAERVRGRGVVVEGWAPQGAILSRGGVGGFVSHCGWSSVVESLYYGVPIIGMPIKYDQPINARLVVGAGAAVEVGRGENGLFTGDEVADAIGKVVVGKGGEELRRRAGELGEIMRKEEEEAADEVADQLLLLCKKSWE